jgi:trans-2,3-dihydro-3-hydroxyanthranilate isomerase
VSARGFFVGDGAVREDPATGSAAGPLCAYLHIRTGADRITIDQGAAMGRPSRLHCAMEGDRIRVGGDVVVVGTGTLLV